MTLHELGLEHGTDKALWHGYCPFYEQHLPRTVSRLLEIGVKDGASLRMWRDFYPMAEVVGIDIRPPLHIEGCTVLQVNAADPMALSALGTFDVIIDDGSHFTSEQIATFGQLYHHQLNPGGWYIMEDAHTSFMPQYRNTVPSTYELLRDRFPHMIEWCRVADRSDSLTLMIQKVDRPRP